MGQFVQTAVGVGLGVATGGLSTVAGMAFYASAAVGAVGAITGDKDLQKLGSLMTLASGIGAATGVLGTEVAAGAVGEEVVAESATGYDLHEADYGDVYNRVADTVTGGAVAPNNPALAGVDPGKATNIAAKANTGTGGTTIGAPAAPVANPGLQNGFDPTWETQVTDAGRSASVSAPSTSFLDKIASNPMSIYGAGLIAQGAGPAISGMFASGTEEEKLAFLKQQEEAKQAELERRAGNFNNISGVNLGVAPSGQRLYRARPLINPYRSPVLPN